MSDKAFIDSNILLYLYSEDETEKCQIAENILSYSLSVISTQVINEISNILHRKFHIHWEIIAQVSEELTSSCVLVMPSLRTIQNAYKIRYSYYDSLIISSAVENLCPILYSEDMQHGQTIDDKTMIINPFLNLRE